jgi:flagellar biosynthesis/type III secretory pathway chaperone
VQDEIIQALEQQVGCYRRLAKLAELQHVHVQQSQNDSLMEVLERRQSVLDEVTQLERVIGPAKRDWSGYLGRIDQELKAQAETLLAETRRLLEQITASDQNDALVLQQRKLNLGKQINQTASARQINRTYAAAAYGTRQSRMNVQR